MKRWWPVAVAGLGWVLLALVRLFEIPLLNLMWVGAVFLTWGAWLVAGTTTLAAVVVAVGGRRRLTAVVVLAVGLGSAVAIVRTEWAEIYVHGYYRLHSDDFAAVAALDEQGSLESTEYYGADLPDNLRRISVTGRAAKVPQTLGAGPAALFLPRVGGIPDGGVGYGRLAPEQRAATFDCFGDPCQARWDLGDGWYWLGPAEGRRAGRGVGDGPR